LDIELPRLIGHLSLMTSRIDPGSEQPILDFWTLELVGSVSPWW
jgi:hypothetical protein